MSVLDHPTASPSVDDLVVRLQPRLKQTLGYYRIPIEDAEDLLQDTFLTLVYRRQAIRNPEAWLVSTVRFRCLMYWRSQRARLCDAIDGALLELVAGGKGSGQEVLDLRHDLERMVARLPARCRSLLRLRYGLGCTPAETATQLGYRDSSIRKATSRCLAALTREMVEGGFDLQHLEAS